MANGLIRLLLLLYLAMIALRKTSKRFVLQMQSYNLLNKEVLGLFKPRDLVLAEQHLNPYFPSLGDSTRLRICSTLNLRSNLSISVNSLS